MRKYLYPKLRRLNDLVLITGPSDGGLGAEAARTLAIASPKLIVLAGRSIAKIKPVADQIESAHPDVATKYVPLDLGSQASVREAAASINASVEKIDVVINNAAIMACPFAKTVDGIESQFGTNYVGHFLLTNLLMEKILAAGSGSRIVNVSSSGHRMADVRLDDWNFEVDSIFLFYRTGETVLLTVVVVENGALYHPWKAYGQAKTATILFTVALASKLKSRNIHAFSLHPGCMHTVPCSLSLRTLYSGISANCGASYSYRTSETYRCRKGTRRHGIDHIKHQSSVYHPRLPYRR